MADKNTITCNACGNQIELSTAISQEIAAKEKKKLDAKIKSMEQEYLAKIEAEKEALIAAQKQENESLKQRLLQDFQDKFQTQMTDLQAQVSEKNQRLQEMADAELNLRKEKRQLEEMRQQAELEKERIRDAAREEALKDASDAQKLKDAENQQKFESMHRTIEDLERKLKQGSQQLQGEALEVELETLLKKEFVFDSIEPVGKGVRGADVLQVVKTQSGRECGRILWETKRTKAWSEKWVEKLKEDQRECRADLAVLVSETLPPGFHHFRKKSEVWVTDIPSIFSLALALRTILIQVDRAHNVKEGKNEKMAEVYDYVTGTEFRHRVEAIVDAFSKMQDELEAEKRAMTKIWAKREKQIETVIKNTLGFRGDLEGIANDAMPKIESLELGWDGEDDRVVEAELDQ